jgi:hypothetical protein
MLNLNFKTQNLLVIFIYEIFQALYNTHLNGKQYMYCLGTHNVLYNSVLLLPAYFVRCQCLQKPMRLFLVVKKQKQLSRHREPKRQRISGDLILIFCFLYLSIQLC